MSLPGHAPSLLACPSEASQSRQDSGVPSPPTTASHMSKLDDSSKPAVAMSSVSMPSDTSKPSNPPSEHEALGPINDPLPLPLPFEFQISLDMLLVVHREDVTANTRYARYFDFDDPLTERDFRGDGEYSHLPYYEIMEPYFDCRRPYFLAGILREEGDLDVCPKVGGSRGCNGRRKWHVYSLACMDLPAADDSDEEERDEEDSDGEKSSGYESDGRTIIDPRLSWRERIRNRSKFADEWWDYACDQQTYISSTGVSLISRSLEFPSPEDDPVHRGGLDEVTEYLDVLTDDEDKPWQCLSTSYHGRVEVNISLPSGHGDGGRPLRVMQHLAYLLVKYEDVVLYHFREEARPGRDFENLGSNRNGITHPNHRQCKPFSLGPLDDVKRKIFSKDMTFSRLGQLMSAISYWDYWEEPASEVSLTRRKFVDFCSVVDQSRLITFRQLRGTMDSCQINHWIKFVTRLVRTAEMKAEEEAPELSDIGVHSDRDWGLREGGKYNNTFGTFGEREKELFDLMKLPGSSSRYRQPRALPPNPDDIAIPSIETDVEEEAPAVQDDPIGQDQALTGEKRKREADEDVDSETDTPPAKCAREA